MEKVKEFLKRLFVNIVERKTIVKLLIVVLLVLLVYVLSNVTFWAQSTAYKQVNIDNYSSTLRGIEDGEEIPVSSTNLLVSENDKYTLSVNTKTTNVIVESKATGKQWMTLPKTTGITIYGNEKSYSQSNIILEYEV